MACLDEATTLRFSNQPYFPRVRLPGLSDRIPLEERYFIAAAETSIVDQILERSMKMRSGG